MLSLASLFWSSAEGKPAGRLDFLRVSGDIFASAVPHARSVCTCCQYAKALRRCMACGAACGARRWDWCFKKDGCRERQESAQRRRGAIRQEQRTLAALRFRFTCRFSYSLDPRTQALEMEILLLWLAAPSSWSVAIGARRRATQSTVHSTISTIAVDFLAMRCQLALPMNTTHVCRQVICLHSRSCLVSLAWWRAISHNKCKLRYYLRYLLSRDLWKILGRLCHKKLTLSEMTFEGAKSRLTMRVHIADGTALAKM